MKEKRYMSHQEHKKIIISGGGTGGHIFPAVSVANALRRIDPETDILFVGAEGRMEMEKVPDEGYRITGLPISGINRKLTMSNILLPEKIFSSLVKARKIIKEFLPDVAVGFGGYASGPVLRQAGKMSIPTLIQEQNSYAGITNRILARRASVICVAYDGMERYFPEEKIIKTGNPVRHNIHYSDRDKDEAVKYFRLKKDMPVVLILGGSLGAGKINRSFYEHIDKVSGSGLQFIWQTGKNYYDEVKGIISGNSCDNISLYGFIERMDYAYSVADIIVSRAGAGTISELCLVGKPVILVPSPNVAEDHQTHNAMALTRKGAAVLVPDDQAVNILVDKVVELISDVRKRKALSERISELAEKDSDIRIAEEVFKLAGR